MAAETMDKEAPPRSDDEGISVLLFDYSAENHLKAVDSISQLCGETGTDFDENEINRLSSSITFLREWKHFSYEPRTVRFYNELENILEEKEINNITLPQFSSAAVQKGKIHDNSSNGECSKDFVMYVGGSVWALDWCPRVNENPGARAKCEFLAVAAHPPASYDHKIGVPLTGRGIIQIWCIPNAICEKEIVPAEERNQKRKSRPGTSTVGMPRGRPKKKPPDESLQTTEPKRPRGRPRKHPIETTEPKKPSRRSRKKATDENPNKLDSDGQHSKALVVHYPVEFAVPLAIKGPLEAEKETSVRENQVESESSGKLVSSSNSIIRLPMCRKRSKIKGTEKSISSMPSDNNEAVTHEITGLDSMIVGNVHGMNSLNIKGPLEAEKEISGRENQVASENSGKLVCSGKSIIKLPRKRSKIKSTEKSICSTPSDNNQAVTHAINEQDSMVVDDVQGRNSLNVKGLLGTEKETTVRENQTESENCGKLVSSSKSIIKLPRKRSKIKGTEKGICSTPSDNNGAGTHETTEQDSVVVGNIQDWNSLNIKGPLETEKGTFVRENQVESENSGKLVSSSNSVIKLPTQRKRSKFKGTEKSICSTPSDNNGAETHEITEQDSIITGTEQDRNSLNISKDTSLPRVVLCLAHNGKVAWDMKWRPSNEDASKNKHRMGYLAVLLGNGSLEVWEVPMPQALKTIFLSSCKAGTDPRFVKLAPTFRCSKLKCGDAQSIPLTVEWSTMGNPDFLLAGCHDGSVALWKFSTSKSSEDTRPLLFFSADTAPIRAVAWAPSESDPQSTNVIATAGHGGLKFWDIRDPFHPLWDLHPVPRFIYSLDWLSDPRCVVSSFDDGTMRILSLMKAAYDVPVTGKQFSGTKLQGFSVYNCSSSPIWNVQVSRLTGIAAYCSADGTVLQFQLTSKSVEKDSRYRTPHFLCGFLTMEDSELTVHTPLPNNPIVLRKLVNESGEAPRCLRSLLSSSPNKSMATVSDVQPLALTYGEDQCIESEAEGTSKSQKSNKAPKSITKKGKINAEENNKDNDDDVNNNHLALVCVEEEQGNKPSGGKERGGNKPEGFPPKMVAMHRVRWNMNKGSERWLCYGGAAGIVRCQEIVPPDVVHNRARRKVGDK